MEQRARLLSYIQVPKRKPTAKIYVHFVSLQTEWMLIYELRQLYRRLQYRSHTTWCLLYTHCRIVINNFLKHFVSCLSIGRKNYGSLITSVTIGLQYFLWKHPYWRTQSCKMCCVQIYYLNDYCELSQDLSVAVAIVTWLLLMLTGIAYFWHSMWKLFDFY